MNGPEHYAAAEQCEKQAMFSWMTDNDLNAAEIFLRSAQIHATLALAAITFDASSDVARRDEWSAATSAGVAEPCQ